MSVEAKFTVASLTVRSTAPGPPGAVACKRHGPALCGVAHIERRDPRVESGRLHKEIECRQE